MSGNAAAMLHYNHVAITMIPPGVLNDAAQACTYRITQSRLYVEPGMEARASRERIAAISKTAPHLGGRRNGIVFFKPGSWFSIHRWNRNGVRVSLDDQRSRRNNHRLS